MTEEQAEEAEAIVADIEASSGEPAAAVPPAPADDDIGLSGNTPETAAQPAIAPPAAANPAPEPAPVGAASPGGSPAADTTETTEP